MEIEGIEWSGNYMTCFKCGSVAPTSKIFWEQYAKGYWKINDNRTGNVVRQYSYIHNCEKAKEGTE